MSLSKLARSDLLCQVASGMEYLSSHHFVHTSLNTCHILIEDNYHARISDLYLGGFEHSLSLKERWRYPFPLRTTAPEVLCVNTPTVKSDVWSFGALMFEMFSGGHVPFENITDYMLINSLRDIKSIIPPPPEDLPQFLTDSYKCCLSPSPNERPTFKLLHEVMETFVLEVYCNSMH